MNNYKENINKVKKIVVITGAARGIGKAIAQRFLMENSR